MYGNVWYLLTMSEQHKWSFQNQRANSMFTCSTNTHKQDTKNLFWFFHGIDMPKESFIYFKSKSFTKQRNEWNVDKKCVADRGRTMNVNVDAVYYKRTTLMRLKRIIIWRANKNEFIIFFRFVSFAAIRFGCIFECLYQKHINGIEKKCAFNMCSSSNSYPFAVGWSQFNYFI